MKKFVPMYVDIVFKKIWGDPENVDRLSFLLSKVLNIPYDDLKGNVEILESEKRLKNQKEKLQRNDIVARIEIPKTKVNLEMNRGNYNQSLIDRNVSYIVHIFSGGIRKTESYKNITPSIQINFNTFSINEEKVIDKFYIQDDSGYKLTKKLQIYEIDIEKCSKICYTLDMDNYSKEDQEIIKIGALMMENSKNKFNEKLEGIEMEERMKKDINETMEDLSEDEEILNYFDYEQDKIALENGRIEEEVERQVEERFQKEVEKVVKEAVEQAVEEAVEQAVEEAVRETSKTKAYEIAKNMLNKNMDLNVISEITGIPKEELE